MNRVIGMSAAWGASVLLVCYAITLVLGLLSLTSPDDPIGNPYFTVLELLIILMMPLMLLVMVALHGYAEPNVRIFSLTALVMMVLCAAITSAVHLVILTISRDAAFAEFAWKSQFFSFKWPSVVYALDILAWDWFFGLSMLFAVPILRVGRLEFVVRLLMIVSGVLSLAGLIGVPLADMQVRMIGVVGYAGVTPILFLLLGIVFKRSSLSAHSATDRGAKGQEGGI